MISAEAEAIRPQEAGLRLFHSVNSVYRAQFGWMLDDAGYQDLNARLFANACDMAMRAPVYTPRVSRTGAFWDVIKLTINGKCVTA